MGKADRTHLTTDHQSAAGRARGDQQRQQARAKKVAKVQAELDVYLAVAAETDRDTLPDAIVGMLITHLSSGNIWQRQRAAGLLLDLLNDGDSEHGRFDELIGALHALTSGTATGPADRDGKRGDHDDATHRDDGAAADGDDRAADDRDRDGDHDGDGDSGSD